MLHLNTIYFKIHPAVFCNYIDMHQQYWNIFHSEIPDFHWQTLYRVVMNMQMSSETSDIKLCHDVTYFLDAATQSDAASLEWASSTGYFSQSDASLWHSLLLNWPTATERTAEPCVEADLSSTQPAEAETEDGLAEGERDREKEKERQTSAKESHHLYPALYPCLAKMNHSPGEKEPETTEPMRYLR